MWIKNFSTIQLFEKTRCIWFLVKNLDLDSKFYYLKKFIKKASKILKLIRKDPTPEPYRCAGLKLVNKYYETDPNPKRPYSLTPIFFSGSFTRGIFYFLAKSIL